jgi:hypothetical protein
MSFWKVLFDPGQYTCFSHTAKGTAVFSIEEGSTFGRNFFSINALDPKVDHNPTENYHDPAKPRRADKNVICYRNFLIEFDKMPLEEQQTYVETIKLPFSTCTFSGGKSYHFIISLEEPLQDAKQYAIMAARLQKAVVCADKATKNPSRLSRTPGALRDGIEQTLIACGDRIPFQLVDNWIKSKIGYTMRQKKPKKLPQDSEMSPIIRADTKKFLEEGAEEGGRNPAVFKASCDLFRCGHSFDEVYEMVYNKTTLPDFEVRNAIKSAKRTTQK